ncbi:MAG: nucleotidyltransferase domain-containing protein [Bacteroidales bacterium]
MTYSDILHSYFCSLQKVEMELSSRKKKELTLICQRYQVAQLFIFGSMVKNNLRDESDMDFIVYFKDDLPLLDYADNFFDLIYELEKLLGRRIDLISGKAMKNPYFIKETERTKKLIYDETNNTFNCCCIP